VPAPSIVFWAHFCGQSIKDIRRTLFQGTSVGLAGHGLNESVKTTNGAHTAILRRGLGQWTRGTSQASLLGLVRAQLLTSGCSILHSSHVVNFAHLDGLVLCV
jgi:hypothetical protein